MPTSPPPPTAVCSKQAHEHLRTTEISHSTPPELVEQVAYGIASCMMMPCVHVLPHIQQTLEEFHPLGKCGHPAPPSKVPFKTQHSQCSHSYMLIPGSQRLA